MCSKCGVSDLSVTEGGAQHAELPPPHHPTAPPLIDLVHCGLPVAATPFRAVTMVAVTMAAGLVGCGVEGVQ